MFDDDDLSSLGFDIDEQYDDVFGLLSCDDDDDDDDDVDIPNQNKSSSIPLVSFWRQWKMTIAQYHHSRRRTWTRFRPKETMIMIMK
jgi:hypothetical protein